MVVLPVPYGYPDLTGAGADAIVLAPYTELTGLYPLPCAAL
jgi:hypothetical protein